MMVFSPQSLAFIAVPKTGTTAIEAALRSKADIVFTQGRKHMTAHRFHTKFAPFLAQTFKLYPDRLAVMRDPEEQIRSWYRYRRREEKAGSVNDTSQLSFDEFVLDVIRQNAPPHARFGSQFRMLTSGGELLVHHLFAYETQVQMRQFLCDRFDDDLTFKQKNVSPDVDAPLDPATRKKLRAARASEFDLYARLMDAGGHLVTEIQR